MTDHMDSIEAITFRLASAQAEVANGGNMSRAIILAGDAQDIIGKLNNPDTQLVLNMAADAIINAADEAARF